MALILSKGQNFKLKFRYLKVTQKNQIVMFKKTKKRKKETRISLEKCKTRV